MAAKSGLALVVRAADFSARLHRDQRRKSAARAPYINHPIGVARILVTTADCGDPHTLAAALLHDVVEDTDCTPRDIEVAFGPAVAAIVAELTDDRGLPKVERKRRQVSSAPGKSRAAKLVKLADKLYNLRDLLAEPPSAWTMAQVQGYFAWVWHVVDGLRGVSAPLDAALAEVFRGQCAGTADHPEPFPAVESLDRATLDVYLDAYYNSLGA